MRTECRCSIGTYLLCRRRGTYYTAVGIVRARAVGTVVGRYVNTAIPGRYISRCSTCVSTAAAGTVVVGFVGTCVTSL